jgi:hypothetical protein
MTEAVWYDFSDRTTWFQDKDRTVVAERIEDVRYFASKVGPGMFEVVDADLGVNDLGFVYIDFDKRNVI